MLESLLLAIGLTAPDYTSNVSVEGAYALHQYTAPVSECKCGGKCVNGIITHGDGHTTKCPCPSDCKCKAKGAVTHPPVVLCPECKPSK